jgi:hypothetical protein
MPVYKFIEYQCRYCGRKERKAVGFGRPNPGTCPRKTGDKPHSWVINKKL